MKPKPLALKMDIRLKLESKTSVDMNGTQMKNAAQRPNDLKISDAEKMAHGVRKHSM